MSARIEDAGDRIIVWNGNTARRGALSPELYTCIKDASNLAQEPRIRAIILTSDGPFFCAGGDLNVLIAGQTSSEAERRERIEDLHDVVRQRNITERMFGWLKENRRIVTRFDKLAKSYAAMVSLACSMRCLRHLFSYRA